jgi:hypothetical protein
MSKTMISRRLSLHIYPRSPNRERWVAICIPKTCWRMHCFDDVGHFVLVVQHWEELHLDKEYLSEHLSLYLAIRSVDLRDLFMRSSIYE